LEEYFSFVKEKDIYKLFIGRFPVVIHKFNKPCYVAGPIDANMQYAIKTFNGKCLIKTRCKIGFSFEIYYSNQSDAEKATAWLNSLLILEKICK